MTVPIPVIRAIVSKVMDGFIWAVGYNLSVSLWEWLVVPLLDKIKKFIKRTR